MAGRSPTHPSHRCISLTTDFGTQDGYVGAMKGVLLSMNPRLTIVDITHDIPPQDIRTAAFALLTAYATFPPGTIHVVVVDPDVGTTRRLIAARLGPWTFVAPDNGVLDVVRRREGLRAAVTITNTRYARRPISATFHGRDILAPAAASLSRGLPLERLGPPLTSLQPLALPLAHPTADGGQRGVILHGDHFGNLITNLTAPGASRHRGWCVHYRRRRFPLVRTYASAARNAILALVNSSGWIELAVRDGSAHRRVRARIGDPVELRPQP